MSASIRHGAAPSDPPPAGARPPIAPATRFGDLVISSGQTAHVDGVNIATGIVGDDVDLDTARRAAWQCARNAVTAIADEIDLDTVRSIVRVTVYIASDPGFTQQHLVADAATDYFRHVFPDLGPHTRAAIGVAALPTGSPVEVDAIVRLASPA